MKQLMQSEDGTIGLHTETDGHYSVTAEEFANLFGVALPPLPEGITHRLYEPEMRHALQKGSDVVDGGPMPWPEGDDALARADAVMAAKEAKKTAYVTTLDMGGTINEILG